MRFSSLLLAIFAASTCSARSIHGPTSPLIPSSSSPLQKRSLLDTSELSPALKIPNNQVSRGGAGPSPATMGLLSILGGFLTHLTLGTIYCWGNLQSYMPPSMKYFASSTGTGTPDSLLIIPLGLLAMCIGMPMSSTLQSTLGLPGAMMFGSLIVSLAVFLSSFATTLAPFVLLYSILFGLGIGLAYTAPIVAGWRHYPTKKGLVSGFTLCGFGIGGFIFNLVGSALANPDKLSLDPATKTFPPSVYANFPVMLRKLAVIYLALQVTGAGLLKLTSLPPPAPAAKSGSAPGKYPTLKSAVLSRPFLFLWTCIVLSSTAGLNTVSVYKMYGNLSPTLKSDAYLAMVGGLGSVANGVGRANWGIAQDKVGFSKLFTLLTITQSVVMLNYKRTVGNRFLFTSATMALFLCMGGNFAMAPGACAKLFGPELGPKVFSVLFSSFATAAVGGSYINKALMGKGFDFIFVVMAIMSFMATGLVKSLGDI